MEDPDAALVVPVILVQGCGDDYVAESIAVHVTRRVGLSDLGEGVVAIELPVRGLEEGRSAISPSRFPEWEDEDGFRHFAD